MAEELILLFDRSCPYTTGWYIERAAKRRGISWIHELRCQDAPNAVNRASIRLIDKPAMLPPTLSALPLIMVDDSSHWTEALAWIENHPHRCFWAIDTHTAWERVLEIARHFPLVYAAQHDGTERLRSEGINAHWLPVAAEPDGYHADRGVERDIDVAFVGNVRYPERTEILRLVDAAFDKCVIDQSQDPAKIGEIYSRAKVVINHSVRKDVNMRIFEAASCGAAIATNHIPQEQWGDLDLYRRDYESQADVVPIIQSLLAQDENRHNQAIRNRRVICSRHTYAHRLDTMLAGLAQLS